MHSCYKNIHNIIKIFNQGNQGQQIQLFCSNFKELIEAIGLTQDEIKQIPLEIILKINKNHTISYHPASGTDHDQWRYEQIAGHIPVEKRLSPEQISQLMGAEQLKNTQ